MTLLEDLIHSDQKVGNRMYLKPYVVTRPQYIQLSTLQTPQSFYSPLSDCNLSPDFLMGDDTHSQAYNIKTEPVDNEHEPLIQIESNLLLPNGNAINGHLAQSSNYTDNNVNNNNHPGDATPTESMSLTELDQLLNPELTFYDELQLSRIVKPAMSSQGSMEQVNDDGTSSRREDRMEYDSDSSDSDGSVVDVALGGSFQEVESEIVRQVKKDIRQAQSMLELPADPKCWSSENVRNWILWTLKHYSLGVVENLDNFLMSGREFISMTEADFKARSPGLGTALYAQLDMWLNASTLAEPTPTSSPAKPALPQPSQAYQPVEQRPQQQQQQKYLQLTTKKSTPSSSSSCGPVSPDPLSPTDSTVDNTSFGSSVSSYGSDDESETSGRQTIHLWQFLKMLLLQPQFYGNCIRWIDRENGIFKIEDSQRVAKLWGKRKNRPAMNYDKLSRSIRQYYKKGIIKKTENSKRLVYRFCHPYVL